MKLDARAIAQSLRRPVRAAVTAMAAAVLSSQAFAASVIYDAGTGHAIGIEDLVVGTSHFNATFVGGSYQSVFSTATPTFLGDAAGASAAADSIAAVFNAQPMVPAISTGPSEVLWVPLSLAAPTDFRAAQTGHDTLNAPWRRFGNFFGSQTSDYSSDNWLFVVLSPVPEPAPYAYLLAGLGGLFLGRLGRNARAGRQLDTNSSTE